MLQTPLHEWHTAHNAKMAPFAGWDMPIQYEDGILAEHAHTRESASILIFATWRNSSSKAKMLPNF